MFSFRKISFFFCFFFQQDEIRFLPEQVFDQRWCKIVFKQSRGENDVVLCRDMSSCIGSRISHNYSKRIISFKNRKENSKILPWENLTSPMLNHFVSRFSIIVRDNSDYPPENKSHFSEKQNKKINVKLTGMATILRGINSRNCFIAKCQDLIRIKSSNVYSRIKCPSLQT